MDSYNKLFMIIRKTDLLNYDEKEELLLYLMNLKDQVKSQKEVIDKAIKYIKSYKTNYNPYELSDYNIRQILDILNEVSE